MDGTLLFLSGVIFFWKIAPFIFLYFQPILYTYFSFCCSAFFVQIYVCIVLVLGFVSFALYFVCFYFNVGISVPYCSRLYQRVRYIAKILHCIF